MDAFDEQPGAFESVYAQTSKINRIYQSYLDRTTPYVMYRWLGEVALLCIFMLRIVYAQGWYIVCYTLFIYLLNLFVAFLQPKFDPGLEQEQRDIDVEEGRPLDDEDFDPSSIGAGTGGAASGSTGNEEFRPFIRRLPEFKFWHSATQATLWAFIATWFSVFDIPVFWPILVIYFFALFAMTMRHQIRHMIKYRYLPFDIGKTRYT
ncbi:hypothetical protein CANCADRAFT_46366 [Tortispora caseinolytica NRRL Y-17796]|uniref:Protein RER1 n=1 Tax=Tortispora caseinolytica NRRL Y-17796 TaxID=767744 RepID=A0A1E4T9S7_9ASCO|nr:hypothetical protein CANCADRAFT_46366 [Tortispora caseinolytica NRRL Y-17796]